MTCLSLPLTLAEADAIIAACSGRVDWREPFILGLQAATLVAVLVLALVLAVRAVRG